MTRNGAFLFLACALAAICFVFASCALPPATSPLNSIDLRPGMMTFTGDYVADGTNLSVTLPVENQGSAAAPAFTIHFYLALTSAFSPSTDTDLGTVSAASGVPRNSTVTINASLAIPELNVNEVRYIYAMVDSTGAVAESDETNNQSTTDAAAAVLVYDDEIPSISRTYAIVLQTYLGSDPSKTTGSTDTLMALYRDNNPVATYLTSAIEGGTDFSTIDRSSTPLAPGTYYVVVLSSNPNNGPYALSVRTGNISSSDLPRFVDLTSNTQDTWEPDETPNTFPKEQDKSIPTKPDPVKVGSALNRYSAYVEGPPQVYDWDWFIFVLP